VAAKSPIAEVSINSMPILREKEAKANQAAKLIQARMTTLKTTKILKEWSPESKASRAPSLSSNQSKLAIAKSNPSVEEVSTVFKRWRMKMTSRPPGWTSQLP